MKKVIFMGTLAAATAFVAFTASLATIASVISYLVTNRNVTTLDEMLRCSLAVFFALAGCILIFLVWLYALSAEEHLNAAGKR